MLERDRMRSAYMFTCWTDDICRLGAGDAVDELDDGNNGLEE